MSGPSPSIATGATAHPAARVSPNALHAFGGVWRLTARGYFTLGHWLAVAGMLGVLALFAVGATSSAPRINHYLVWASLFYVCFLVPILAFISAGAVVRDDLKPGVVDYVFTRPLRRPAFVVFRFLSHVACVQLDFFLALGVVVAVGSLVGVAGIWKAIPLLLLGQVIVALVFSAFGFLCGMLTSRYVIVGLLYGALVEVGVGSVPTQLNRISMLRHATEILQPLLGDARIGMGGPLQAQPLSAPAAIALLLAIAAVLVAITAIGFSMKELAGAGGRDN